MSVHPSPPSPPSHHLAVVARLRAAGCVFAEEEADILLSTARTPDELAAMVERRVEGLPLEHVVGWAEFCGLRITLEPGVFVPRRRTEFLARQAAALAPAGAVVLDLCCGSGAVAAALATHADFAELHAADLDPAAVCCARRNVSRFGGEVHEGDLYGPLPAALRGRVDILAANGPYVPTGDVALLPPEARDHERRMALDGGADGLDIMRRVAAGALSGWPRADFFVETSEQQTAEAVAAVTRSGLSARVVTDEDLYATVVIGTKRGAAGEA